MTGKRPWLGVCVIIVLTILVNAFILAKVAWNRGGTPQTVLVLDASEIHVACKGRQEESGKYLTMQVESSFWRQRAHTLAALQHLGFCQWTPVDDHAYLWPDRQVYVALELEGPAYQEVLQRRQQALERCLDTHTKSSTSSCKYLRSEVTMGTRLVIVDADEQEEVLQRKYGQSDQHAIIHAVASYGGRCHDKAKNADGARLAFETAIHVPQAFHTEYAHICSLMHARADSPDNTVPVAVELHVGRLHEWWLTRLEALR